MIGREQVDRQQRADNECKQGLRIVIALDDRANERIDVLVGVCRTVVMFLVMMNGGVGEVHGGRGFLNTKGQEGIAVWNFEFRIVSILMSARIWELSF